MIGGSPSRSMWPSSLAVRPICAGSHEMFSTGKGPPRTGPITSVCAFGASSKFWRLRHVLKTAATRPLTKWERHVAMPYKTRSGRSIPPVIAGRFTSFTAMQTNLAALRSWQQRAQTVARATRRRLWIVLRPRAVQEQRRSNCSRRVAVASEMIRISGCSPSPQESIRCPSSSSGVIHINQADSDSGMR